MCRVVFWMAWSARLIQKLRSTILAASNAAQTTLLPDVVSYKSRPDELPNFIRRIFNIIERSSSIRRSSYKSAIHKHTRSASDGLKPIGFYTIRSLPWLARSTVNREVPSSSLGGRVILFCWRCLTGMIRESGGAGK
ncbi:hypothetical protein AUEXF2481DRAFT_602342 [Aureobasidium subglaciale EXF-2481]|uniref:Secreted protein n=1 Tax=Aureobasidium subglaciale (strain EXF-2481) TaxID=1043005 RepID=A0A074YIH0_AURSE|nr:uncharacterized protein AUEXF2481DRAFT_602342 [Aureobasidium subglaciale EXF-2481]KEQ97500.1 hypothetical protein AUEXF2481DRAFT_602342 [Aureobasidium subglaciale EXF-2481]